MACGYLGVLDSSRCASKGGSIMSDICRNTDQLLPSADWFSLGEAGSNRWSFSHCGLSRCVGSMFELELRDVWILTEWPPKGREVVSAYSSARAVMEYVLQLLKVRRCACD